MNNAEIKAYFHNRLIVKQADELIDPLLLSSTADFLHTIGMPNDDELNFGFDAHMSLLPNGLIRLHGQGEVRPVYLSPRQGDALFAGDDENSFINSGVREFTQCLYELEQYYANVAAKAVFGRPYDEKTGKQNRLKYAAYLEEKIRAVDPRVFEQGYYWPAFIESIEHGLL